LKKQPKNLRLQRPRAARTEVVARRITPFPDHLSRFGAGRLGLSIFLISLAMLFGASLLGFVIIRIQTRGYWPELPPLPSALWLSTVVLIVSSGTMQLALNGIRADRQSSLRMGLSLSLVLGLMFLLIQTACWMTWFNAIAPFWSDRGEVRYALTSFYVLTGLHALHVIGGIIPMTIVTRHAFSQRYRADFHPGVHYIAMYWHFLDAVWIVLFMTLLIGT
jgi:cytochrome c oxidase subunit III